MQSKEQIGFVESAQRLVEPSNRRWNQRVLLQAAEAAELRNTGWPIGVVLRPTELAPKPTNDGIEARIVRRDGDGGPEWDDFWVLREDGSYYVARVLEEDRHQPGFSTSVGHPVKPLWFDIRIWRIAEILLHGAALYRALGVPSDEPYLFSINHVGLARREFWTSAPEYGVHRGQFSNVAEANWREEVTQDYVTGNLKAIVHDIASRLFVLFDFARVNTNTISEMVDRFSGTRI